ncbi:MAG: glycosyltransferase family 4 protein [Bacteroidia bacterium]|nr:glycosyltransferase family 4 protein [Bacteroidia bacterium]
MKVLMLARPDLYKVRGGDTIQINETASGLTRLGVEGDLIINRGIDYRKYDLIHFFNIIDPEDILGHVKKSKLPYVVSTIYVDYREFDKLHRNDLLGLLSKVLPRDSIEYFKTLAKYLLKNENVSTVDFFLKGHRKSIQYILRNAAMLLPNSHNEYQRLKADYGTQQKYKVVPNAINPFLFKPNNSIERDIVLCVARMEGRKNQLNVIKALSNTNYKVVFIGAASTNQKKYVKACKEAAGPNIQFIDVMSQHDLIAYYNRARVHVLASWFETTGLSNLEAGAMGCNLVIGNRGDVREYFGEHAYYCEPGSPESIKAAVDKAWQAPKNDVIQKQIFNNFTWDAAAKVTLQAYKEVLNL